MKSAVKYVVGLCLVIGLSSSLWAADGSLREQVLRKQAIKNGIIPAEETLPSIDKLKSKVGEDLFASELLSFNQDTSCQTCHLDDFSSADGLPNAIGTGGSGEGPERINSPGSIVPRNTLPLWGRGGKGFETFFWDGKVEVTKERVISQFGNASPSGDALVVAIHLPFVEIREMVADDRINAEAFKSETVSSADLIYEELSKRVRQDPDLSNRLSRAYDIEISSVKFEHVAGAISHFIRDKFRVRNTKFHKFVFDEARLTDEELHGGILFYGKGRCVACHNGPYFSDMQYYAIPVPQTGFGKNGFGVDYGRYNTTFNPNDMYRFRTPPLYNVKDTKPYSHSGAVFEMSDMITYHFDPLADKNLAAMGSKQRVELYSRIKQSSKNNANVPYLSTDEVANIEAFLETLSFSLPEK